MKKSKPSALDHYQREKERRSNQAAPDSELMAAARREYLAMLEAQSTKGKGGRPKKKAAKVVKPADDDFPDLEDNEGEELSAEATDDQTEDEKPEE